MVLFFNQLLAVSFDGEFAELRGIPVRFVNLITLLLTALTIVFLVHVVGILLVIALLALPAAAAGQFAVRWRSMMILAIIICMAVTTGGLAVSYQLDWPSGPAIVLLGSFVYMLALFIRWWRKC